MTSQNTKKKNYLKKIKLPYRSYCATYFILTDVDF